jgi:hypothetical protein
MSAPLKVRIVNVKRGMKAGRFDTVYAQVVEDATGDLLISATLSYCYNACGPRNWQIVNTLEWAEIARIAGRHQG